MTTRALCLETGGGREVYSEKKQQHTVTSVSLHPNISSQTLSIQRGGAFEGARPQHPITLTSNTLWASEKGNFCCYQDYYLVLGTFPQVCFSGKYVVTPLFCVSLSALYFQYFLLSPNEALQEIQLHSDSSFPLPLQTLG